MSSFLCEKQVLIFFLFFPQTAGSEGTCIQRFDGATCKCFWATQMHVHTHAHAHSHKQLVRGLRSSGV